MNQQQYLMEQQILKREAIEIARLEAMGKRIHSEESDEGFGHSGSDGDESNRTGSPTHQVGIPRSPKSENSDGIHSLDSVTGADGKRKEDLYKCRYCDRTFCYLCHLKVHERVHTGEKPYSCSYCDCTFSQLGSLTVHMRIHTGEKPYECRICLKKFRHINSLRRHQRQVHRKTPAEVDATPRGGDTPYHLSPHSMSPQTSPRSLASTPQPGTTTGNIFHPYARQTLARTGQPAMKSALEIRNSFYNGLLNPATYAQNPTAQAAAQAAQAAQAQAAQALINPYMRAATPQFAANFQQQLIQQQLNNQQHNLAINRQPSTNHSITSMLETKQAAKPPAEKPKKMGFSISALVGEESEPECVSENTSESRSEHSECQIEEIVDVVSDEPSENESASVDSSSSPSLTCHQSTSSSASTTSTSPASPPLIDEDLRRALTIDPSKLTDTEKNRLRRKLAQIALGQLDRNPSSDSGFSHASTMISC